jgi:hypothetical protein
MCRVTFDMDSLSEPSKERQLWVKVLGQALDDAMQPIRDTMRRWQRMEIVHTREWLTKQNQDFETVCDLAGIEADRFRTFAKQAIQKVKDDIDLQMQQAVTQDRGVVGNFAERQGTGGGRHARECPETDFSQTPETKPCP